MYWGTFVGFMIVGAKEWRVERRNMFLLLSGV
jgi:hypothetical protein